MTIYKENYYAIFANLGMVAFTYVWYVKGYVVEAWNNDIAFIIPAILVAFFIGMISLFRDPKYTRWASEAVLVFGLLGTALGILEAFTSIDPTTITETSKIAGIISEMLNGIGAALWTTITGAFASVWLTVNLAILTRDFEA